MVGHAAVGPNRDAVFSAPVGHQFEVSRIIFRAKKRLLSAISPLGYVVRHAWNDNSCDSSHAENLSYLPQYANIGSCPQICHRFSCFSLKSW